MSRSPHKGRRSDLDPFLVALGERVRTLRVMRGVSRKVLAKDAGISERFLADLEVGAGNASILLLRQLAEALALPLSELVGTGAPGNGEWALTLQLLAKLSERELAEARVLLQSQFGSGAGEGGRDARIALIGLRGAGKSTLARQLADRLKRPFIELNHEIEELAGVDIGEVHVMLGQAAYRRYERRALERVLASHPHAVLATPGSLVSEASTYAFLLSQCFTIWVKASPEEHMARVLAQGDLRPMAGNSEAMDDLRRILAARTPLYAKADVVIDTSGKTEAATFDELLGLLAEHGIAVSSQCAVA